MKTLKNTEKEEKNVLPTKFYEMTPAMACTFISYIWLSKELMLLQLS